MKSITSKNNILLLRRSFHPERFLVALANHWQHLVLRPSRQHSAPVLGCTCTCTARAEASWQLSTDEEIIMIEVTSSLWIWDPKFAFTFTSAKILYILLYPSPNGFWWNISTPWHFCWNLRSSCGTVAKCFQPLHASCMHVTVKPVKRTLEETER